MENLLSKYLTIKEASLLSGRSEYEIRLWTQAQYTLQENAKSETQAQGVFDEEAQQVVDEIVKKVYQTANPKSPMKYVILRDAVIANFGIQKEEEEVFPQVDSAAQPQAQTDTPQAPQQAQQEAPQVVSDSVQELINELKERVRDQAETIRSYQRTQEQLSATVYDHGQTIKALSRLEAPRREAREITPDEEVN